MHRICASVIFHMWQLRMQSWLAAFKPHPQSLRQHSVQAVALTMQVQKIDATVAPSPHLCIFNRACKQSSCSVPVCRNKTRLKPGVVDVELSLANRGCNQSDELFNCGHLLPLRVVTCSEPPRPAPPRPAPSRPVQLAAVFATARARCSRPLSLWGGLMFSAVCYLL